MSDRFPSPFEIQTPPGAEGWEELYLYSSLFSGDRQAYEDTSFWFQDSVHWPEVISPWDATFYEYALASLSQYNTRHYLIPAALGVDFRILNGYAYLSPVEITNPAEIEARAAQFLERAGFYYQNWDRLYHEWMAKIHALVKEISAIHVEPLPEKEAIEVITEGRGIGSGLVLLEAYHQLCDLALRLWQYHFEFLNLGYAAYLDFFSFCKQAFPSIPDLSIAKMVAGVEVDLFRPDDELKKLAKLAIESGIDDVFDADNPDDVRDSLRRTEAGRNWLLQWDEACEPWFNFSSGSGYYHTDRVWIDHLDIPFGFIRNYIDKLKEGANLARPIAAIRAERDRIASEYRTLLASNADREAFDARLQLSRTVFPYVENHNFYVEHWAHSVLWRKMRAFGDVLVKAGFLAEADDIFLIKRDEVPEALWDMYSAWAVGTEPRGGKYWQPEIFRRRRILAALREWSAPPALGIPPKAVTEPFTVMLWGITSESVAIWLHASDDSADAPVSGFGASPDIAEGEARVIFTADQIGEVRPGEILIAPLTAPSWAPIFGKVAAIVTDVGGIMSHAAVTCREYGVPAVTGTAFGTSRIKTGQRVRVNGNVGTVTLLD